MKKLSTLLALVILAACKDDASSLIEGQAYQLDKSSREIALGESAQFKIDGETADSVRYSSGVEYDPQTQTVKISPRSCGLKTFQLTVYADGQKHQLSGKLTVFAPTSASELSYELVEVIDHDPANYTQGLEFNDGFLYESSGNYGQSRLQKFSNGFDQALAKYSFDEDVFAEGITFLKDRLVTLSWREKLGFYFNEDLELVDEKPTPLREGWGLCHFKNGLLASDGSHRLYQLDSNFRLMGMQEIYNGKQPLNQLNELEFTPKGIWTNVYHSDRIYRLDPETGVATHFADLGPLREKLGNAKAEVLNGIAWHPERQQLLVTGKYWDKAFWIELAED